MAIFHGYSMAISTWRPGPRRPPVVGLADRDPALCRRQHRSAAETSKAAADQNHVLKRKDGPLEVPGDPTISLMNNLWIIYNGLVIFTHQKVIKMA